MIDPISILGLIPSLLGYWQKKQEMKLRWYELIISVLRDFLGIFWTFLKFCWRHKLIISYGLILGYCLYQNNALKNYAKAEHLRANKAETALIAYVQSATEAARQRDIDNEAKRQKGKQDTAALINSHKNIQAQILYHSKQKEAKHADTQKLNNSKLIALRDGLSLAVKRQADAEAARLPINDTNRFAIGDGDAALFGQLQEAETALDVCQEAGAVAAADYNLCYGYVKSQQSIIGVEK